MTNASPRSTIPPSAATSALPLRRRAALWRGGALALWGLLLLRSSVDGRLDLLLRAAFHPLVAFAGVALGATVDHRWFPTMTGSHS